MTAIYSAVAFLVNERKRASGGFVNSGAVR
jgi:hypothetical protein